MSQTPSTSTPETFHCTVSLGIVITNKEFKINQLYQMSDDLLYQSKEEGRDRQTVGYLLEEVESEGWESKEA